MEAQVDTAPTLESVVTGHTDTNEFRRRTGITKSRQVLKINANDLPNNLTETTIAGLDMIAQGPYVFADDESGSLLVFYHLGVKLSGHSGIVHGGLSAVLLDECMGRACFPLFPGKIGVTAKLDLSFKSPIPVNSIVLVRATTTSVEGRKAWVEATIEDAQKGTIMVEAKGLFIEPRWSNNMPKVL